MSKKCAGMFYHRLFRHNGFYETDFLTEHFHFWGLEQSKLNNKVCNYHESNRESNFKIISKSREMEENFVMVDSLV
jgi:hypothetical protein